MHFQGSIDHIDQTRIEGWIVTPDRPDQKLSLTFYVGDMPLGTCIANKFRQDLADAKVVDGNCAFSFDVPTFISAAQLKQLRVQVTDSDLFWYPAKLREQDGATSGPSRNRKISRFGGLWIDGDDWGEILGTKHRNGEISDDLCKSIFSFVRDGYLIIPGAVSPTDIDALNDEVNRFWSKSPPGLMIETFEPDGRMQMIAPDLQFRPGRTKMLDLFAFSPAVRKAIAAPKVVEFLAAIFEDKPKPFQGLTFWRGSQQAMHKDTAYVKVDTNPLALAATWLALEDVTAGTGELEYFVGSHRAPDFLFGGSSKWMESFTAQHDDFLKSLHLDAENYRQKKASFLARKGDVLIWHADLAHGGSEILQPKRTRKSLVTHFTSAHDEPFYRRTAKHQAKEEHGCIFVSQYSDIRSG